MFYSFNNESQFIFFGVPSFKLVNEHKRKNRI